MMSALLLSAVIVLAAESAKAPDAAYVQSFEKWKAEQTADLKENWLSLAGLFWLKPGANTFGSNPDECDRVSEGTGPRGRIRSEREQRLRSNFCPTHTPRLTARPRPPRNSIRILPSTLRGSRWEPWDFM